MEAITREEKLMSAASSGKSSGIKPITREEMYLSYIAGESKKKPKPITRKEMFLDKIEKGEGGGTSGGGDIVPLLEGTIEEITIPNEVTNLAKGVFGGCSVLKEINADESHEVYASDDGILYTKDGKKLVSYPPAKEETEYIMPDSVEEVESMAFNNTTRLERVVVGENTKTLPKNIGVENEEAEIALIAKVDIMEQGGVYPVESEAINTFVIPKGTTFVSATLLDALPNVENLYYNDGELEKVGITDSKGSTTYEDLLDIAENLKKLVCNIKDIVSDTFSLGWKSNIKTLIIGDDVETIGDDAFYRWYIEHLKIGNNVKSIGYGAFRNTTSLSGHLGIPDSVTELGEDESGACYTFYLSPITELTIGKGLTKIGAYAFESAKISDLVIPSNIKLIDTSAFYRCELLTRLEIEEGVEEIRDRVFASCYNLADIYIPRSVTTIFPEAFIYAGANVDGGLTIHGYAGSYAETFATENGFNFEVIEE